MIVLLHYRPCLQSLCSYRTSNGLITTPHAGERLLPLFASHVKRADHKPSRWRTYVASGRIAGQRADHKPAHWRTSAASGRIARHTGMITGPHGGEPLLPLVASHVKRDDHWWRTSVLQTVVSARHHNCIESRFARRTIVSSYCERQYRVGS